MTVAVFRGQLLMRLRRIGFHVHLRMKEAFLGSLGRGHDHY